MPRFSFASLRVRLICLVFICVLPLLGLTLYTDMEERRAEMAQAREHLRRMTEIAAANEDRLLQGARHLLIALAQLPEVRSNDPDGCSALLSDLLKYYPFYANIGVVDPDSNVFCSAVPFTQPVDADNHAWFQRAIKKRDFAVGDYHTSRLSSKAVIVFSYPVLKTADQVQSVVFVALDLDWLNQLATKVQLPEGAALIVIDRNGTILAHYPDPEKWVGQSAPDAPIIKAMLTQGKDIAEIRSVDGIQRLYAFTPLSDSADADVYMAVGITLANPFAEANRTLTRNLTGLGLVAALAIAAAWVDAYLFLLRPVNKLVNSTKRIAAGDLSTRTGLPQGPGKLSQLSLAFDNMAESLERHSSERQRVEAEFRRANSLFELACAAISSIIYDWDIEKNTIERTQGLIDVLGYRPQEAELTPEWWFERIHPDYRQRVRDQIAAELENPILNFTIEYRIRHKDNHYLYVWDKGLIVRNVDGRAERVVGSIIDITEQKRAEAEIRQLNETLEQRVLERTAQLEAANKELDAFSYSVSHDLRAPLRHVRGFVDALAQQLKWSGASADPQIAHYIEVIQDSSQKMGQLIDGLLTLSHVGRRQLANQPVNLRQLVDTAIAFVMSETEIREDRPIEFIIGDLPTVSGDPTLLQQVFSNLIDNAVKFSPDRHPARIQIGTLADGTIFVKDNGVGFQMEYAEQVFGAFGRLHSQREFKGTGIGLAIVQRIIQRHGGTIWVESAPNQGATFYFKLRSSEAV